MKPLEEMNFEELGRLFPIILSEYSSDWPILYAQERDLIQRVIGLSNVIRINHYGSTSIPGIYAKPTIDILMELCSNIDLDMLIGSFISMGYRYSPQPDNPPPHMMFMKGYTLHGYDGQAYHVHVRYSGDWDELYFRDYLVLHPEIAEEYGKLKLQLKEQYEYDREAYTHGKTGFINVMTEKARIELGRKY